MWKSRVKSLQLWPQISYLIFTVLFFVASYNTQAQQTAQRDSNGVGYLEYLPPGYTENTDLYPVIIFLHGQGERGNGSPSSLEKVKKNGPPKHIKNGHNMCFEYNGLEECFIVLSPQTNAWNWFADDTMPFIETAIDNYRIDPDRVYFMGISMGGQGVWRIAYSDENSDNIFAALSVAPGKGDYQDACRVAEANTAVWAFHGTEDNSSMPIHAGERPINGMIACGADPAPIFTVYEGVGHNSWGRAYRTDNSLHTPNIYQWFLAQRLGESSPIPPTVNAGADKILTLPENNLDLSALANDVDGEVLTIFWERVSGPNDPTVGVVNTLDLTLEGLIEGSYNYRITVTDNDGLSSSDQVIVTVLPEPANSSPSVSAGDNTTITLPTSSLTLSGSATDTDGTISNILWEQVSGPSSASIASAANLSTVISSLNDGSYTFSLTATDDDGASSSDNITVTVQPEPPNEVPSANAGTDLEVTLPDNSATIIGAGTDSDGTIVSFVWEQSSGPNAANTTDLNESEITISNLVQGAYVFTLIVTDDDGDTDSDQVIVNVLPIPANIPPTANAGNDQTITLPVNSYNLQGSGLDVDGTIQTYLWAQENGPNTAIFGTPTEETTAATALVEGIYTFSLTVTDDDGDSNTDNVQVTVLPSPANEPPTVDAGDDATITLPSSSITLTSSASDEDGSIESYLWELVSGPNTPSLDDSVTPSVTISGLVDGVYQFMITVSDDDGATAVDQIGVTVFPEQNNAPNANAGDDLIIVLPSNTADLNGVGTDNDGSIVSYSWSQVTGPNTASIMNSTEPTTALEGLIEGIYSFRLIVVDDDDATDTDQMTLRVLPEPVNIPPTAEAGEDVYLTLPENSTTLYGQGSDSDGTIVSYRWDIIEAGNSSIDEIDSFEVEDLTISGLETGVYIFSLTVLDNNGASAADQVRVFVDTPNSQPVSDAGQDIDITLPQASVELLGSASDPDGAVAFSLWEQVSGPNTANIGNELSLNTTLSDLIEGIYILNLMVKDNDGLEDHDEIRITVNPTPPNIPPIVNAGDDIQATLPVGDLELTGSANDDDGDILSLQWNQIDGPTTLEGFNLTTNSPVYSGFGEGVYTIRFTATDDDGALGSDDVRLTILEAPGNQLPTVNAGLNVAITLPNNVAQLNGSAFDTDGSIESYNWTQIQGPTIANISNANQAVTDVENLMKGIYTFRLTTIDNQGGASFDQVNVRVNPKPANQPPVVVSSTNETINLPQTSVSLSATASDADGTVETIEWTQRSGPSLAVLSNTSSLNLGVEDLKLGTYIFRITVVDNSGVANFDEVNVRVLEELANQPPTVAAGANQLIYTPESVVIVDGYAEDMDGSIVGSEWLQVSGPSSAFIVNPAAFETEIQGLVEGTYVFRLESTDNNGLIGFDQLGIRVNAELVNLPPNANANENVVLVLPQSQVVLTGEANDPDGSLQSINWTQEFGSNEVDLVGTNELNLQISNLVSGFYLFRLTVTDNEGASDFDEVSITVNDTITQKPPVVNAGADFNVVLPIESVELSGQATNEDGTIESILWEQLSGPSESTVENSNNFSATVSDLVVGAYVFRLVVKNSEGLQNFDLISLTVKANQAPFAFAGVDTTLTLPASDFLLIGQGVDNDGTVETVEWKQLEGPNVLNIYDAAASQTKIDDLMVGIYQLEFRVVDNKGAESFDILRVEVVTDAENLAPSVNVGEDITIQLPENSVQLSAVAEDPDGEILQFQWERISGGDFSFVSPESSSTIVENLGLGDYVFQLTVTDNGGLLSNDQLNVFVIAPDEPPGFLGEFNKLFTPNGDGINDFWVSPALEDLNDCSIIIYNRLGTKLFEEKDYYNNWDGKTNTGRPLEEGAYFFVISCEDNFVKKGSVRIKK